MGELQRARSELAKVRGEIESRVNELPVNGGEGYWFDWIFARILLREAVGMIVPTDR
jgi:hypothetical protein